MLGAIIGDVIGSVYEWNNVKSTDFPLFSAETRFTDDTVLTIAIADAIMTGAGYTEKLKEYFDLFPDAGYGGRFFEWAASENSDPYNSWGNGSAMRVSPVGFAFDTLDDVLREAEASAAVTHNHPEGIKGAQAVASAIFLGRTGKDKDEIRNYICSGFGYDLDERLDMIRGYYTFDVSCKGSVPQAIIAFLESENFLDAIRKAISIGGDSDTIACICGAIAQAYYSEIPEEIEAQVKKYLPQKLLSIVDRFSEKYGW